MLDFLSKRQSKVVDEKASFSGEDLAIITDLTESILSTLSLDDLLQTSIDNLVNRYGFLGGILLLKEDYGLYAKTLAGGKNATKFLKLIGSPISDLQIGLSEKTENSIVKSVLTGEVVFSYSLQDFTKGVLGSSVSDIAGRITGTNAAISIPIKNRGEVIGALFISKKEKETFDNELPMLNLVSSQIGVAIVNAKLFNATEAQLLETEIKNSQLSLIHEVASMALSSLDYKEILSNTAEMIVSKEGFDGVLFCILEDTHNEVKDVVGASSDISKEELDKFLPKLQKIRINDEGSDSLIEQSIQSKEYKVSSDLNEILPSEWKGAMAPFSKSILGSRSMIVVPLVGITEVIGAAVFVASEDDIENLKTKDVSHMETLAQIVGSTTETAIAYTQKQIALDKLEAARQREKDMMDIMGHELRTPLSIIRMSLGLLKNKIKTARDIKEASQSLKKYVERIDTAVDRESTLLERMLSSTKIDANRMELHLEKLDMTTIIDDAILGVTPSADAKNVIIKFNRPKEDAMVFADKVRLAEVMDNLVGNAVKYTPEGTVEIEITEKRTHLEVKIIDTGMGIPKGAIPHLGEKFYRVGQYTNGNKNMASEVGPEDLSIVRPGGTGLGLYVSFELIKRMGGKIKVDSEVGKGTTFKFTVPKYDGQEEVITGDKADKDVFKRMGFTQNDN